jgi:hypothetical protein
MKLSDEVRATSGQDGAILFDIRHGKMFRLNPVGSRALECQAEPAEVVRDLREFFGLLKAYGLVQASESEPHAAA